MRRFSGTLVLFCTASCATVFRGEPYVEGGVNGCQAKCRSWGMELVGMVAMGDSVLCPVAITRAA